MKSVILMLSVVLSLGCKIDRKDTEHAVEEISTEMAKLTKTVSEYVNQAEAPEELRKLQQWEYQVLTLPVSTPLKDLESRLNELGKERWDCFHGEKITSAEGPLELLLVCKRRPYTPLKYLPRNLVGG